MKLHINSNKYGKVEAEIDDEDFNTVLKGWSFYVWKTPRHNGFYLMGYSPDNRVTPKRVHRIIMKAKEGEIVDHINRNPLDNRKENLRITDYFGNNENSSKRRTAKTSIHKGVDRLSNGKWRAQIQIKGKKINLGTFLTESLASLAYNKALEINNLSGPKNSC